MADRDTLAILAGELGQAVQPLAAALRSTAGYRDLLEDLGWSFTAVPQELESLRQPVTTLIDLISQGEVDTGQIPALLGAVKAVFNAISDLSSATGLDQEFRDNFPRQLVDYLVVEYLLNEQPRWGFLLMVLGILRLEDIGPQGTARPAYIGRKFAFEELDDLLTDPLGYLKGNYGWGTSAFDGERFAVSLGGLLRAWNLPMHEQRVDEQTRAALQAGAVSPDDAPDISPHLILVEDSVDPGILSAGVGLYLLPETAGDKPGFALLPFASADFGAEIRITPRVTLSFETAVDLTSDVGFFVRPNKDVQFLGGLDSGAPVPIAGELKAVMRLGTPGEPILILGSPDASRFEFGGISTTAGLRLQGAFDVFAEFALQAGKIVVKPAAGEGDSFLSQILPSNLEVNFDLMVGFATNRGIYFGGSSKFEVVLPVNLKVGPVEIASASAAIGSKDGAIAIDVATTLSAQISAVTATVQDIGVTGKLTFPADRKGNLGPVDLSLGFKPPTGIGIFIESSSVSGGGFLFFDQANGRYGGALELRTYDIDIKAFGLIETKVPGVSFSFVIMISAEFNPIQLGFGFTLDGVGGLIGINRTVDSKVLASRVRDGTLDHVLFPHNLIQNAPALISELATLFPAAADHHTFGPLAKLGWARIVHGTIGLILELPSKALTIIGNVNAILPKPDNPIVILDMDIGGKLDFPKKHFELDATLSPNSKVGNYTITGDMATRIDWGDRPNFAISMGGFHSQFTPPPGFPALRRMSIALGINGNPSVTLQGFMALTSNTAQIGAQLDVYASFGATLTGSVGFEALFVFSPFSFDARLWGDVHVDFLGVGFGLTLDGRIRGPSPWVIDGEVCVSLWFDSACVGIHKQLDGAPAPVPLPTLDPWLGDPATEVVASRQKVPGLKAAILDTSNWAGRLPPGVLIGVTYVERKDKAKPPVDPVGIATFRQKAVPLDYDITRFAGTTPSRKGKLLIGPVTAGGSTATVDYITDWFAPGQYRKMTNDQALHAKPFEQLKAGVELQSAVLKMGSVRNRPVTYRTKVLDVNGNEVTTPSQQTHQLPARHFAGLMKSTSASRLSARLTGRTRFIDIKQKPRITDDLETFSVTSKSTLGVVDQITNVTWSEAAAALDAKAGTSTFNRQQYQIVGTHMAA